MDSWSGLGEIGQMEVFYEDRFWPYMKITWNPSKKVEVFKMDDFYHLDTCFMCEISNNERTLYISFPINGRQHEMLTKEEFERRIPN